MCVSKIKTQQQPQTVHHEQDSWIIVHWLTNVAQYNINYVNIA